MDAGAYLLVVCHSKTTIREQGESIRFPIIPHTLCNLFLRVQSQDSAVRNVHKVQSSIWGADRALQEDVRCGPSEATTPLGRLTCTAQRVRNVEINLRLDCRGCGIKIHGGGMYPAYFGLGLVARSPTNTSPPGGLFPILWGNRTFASETVGAILVVWSSAFSLKYLKGIQGCIPVLGILDYSAPFSTFALAAYHGTNRRYEEGFARGTKGHIQCLCI